VATLIVLDDRVRERAVTAVDRGVGGGVAGVSDMVASVGNAITLVARNQTIEQAPMLIFVVLAGLLVSLMLRT
jgi:hypothetical protein